MDTLRYDLIQAVRSLQRAPRLSATVVVTLAVGIAVVSAFFSLLNGILFRPLPYPESGELVAIQETRPDRRVTQGWVSHPAYRALQESRGPVAQVGAYDTHRVSLAAGEWVATAAGVRVEPATLDLLGVAPALGRSLGPGDAFTGTSTVVLLGHDLWTGRFESDPDVLGTVVRVDGRPVEVVGVMPEDFTFPERGELWMPFNEPRGEFLAGSDGTSAVARLADGSTDEAVADHLGRVARALAETGEVPTGSGLRTFALVNRARGGFGAVMGLLLGVGGVVLLVVCSNVASLLLARTARRRSDMAVRSALGASRRRLVAQALAEGLILALAAGGLGLVLSTWMVNGFLAALDLPFPGWFDPRIDLRVVGFTALVSAASVLAFGLPAALEGSRVDLVGALGAGSQGVTGGRRSRRLRGLVIAVEVALAFVLVTGGTLMATSIARVDELDLGVDGDRVLRTGILLRGEAYEEPEGRDDYFVSALERIGAVPGVESAALEGPALGIRGLDEARDPAVDSVLRGALVTDAGRRVGARERRWSVVTPDYFETMGLDLLSGRAFSSTDREGSPRVAVVSEALAQALWPDDEAVGRTVRAGGADGLSFTVVGVVEEYRRLVNFGTPGGGSAGVEPGRHFYVPFAQATAAPDLFARSARGDAEQLAPGVRAALRDVDPDQAITYTVPVSASRTGLTDAFGVIVRLVLALAGVGGALAAMGIYGVIAQGVAERRREIGIRTALGGPVERVVGLIMREGVWLAVWGLLLGLGLSLVFTRVLGSLLYDVAPSDPLILAGVAALFLAVGASASFLPARRAARIDPSEALRAD